MPSFVGRRRTAGRLARARRGSPGLKAVVAALMLSLTIAPWTAKGDPAPDGRATAPVHSEAAYAELAAKAEQGNTSAQIVAATMLAGRKGGRADPVLAMKWFLCAGEQLSPATWPSRALSARVMVETALSKQSYARAQRLAAAECGLGQVASKTAGPAPRAVDESLSLDWRTALFGPGSAIGKAADQVSGALGLDAVERSLRRARQRNPDVFADLGSLVLILLWGLTGVFLVERLRDHDIGPRSFR
ncbi:MAG: hypothetical protein R3316_04375 [Rhodovibrionaceae bacterium]|nr:hypothetical protein [Rhodovibrionaceae bacterium]